MKYLILLLALTLTAGIVFASGNSEAPSPTKTDEGSQFMSNPGSPPVGIENEFSTDFSRSLIRFDTIFSGGPKKKRYSAYR